MTRVTSYPWRAAAYFMLLSCMRLKLFGCRFVPLLEPNPGDATAPKSYVQLLYRPDCSQCPNSQTLKFHSPANPDPLNARSLRSLRFPKSPPLKILDPPMVHIYLRDLQLTKSKMCKGKLLHCEEAITLLWRRLHWKGSRYMNWL